MAMEADSKENHLLIPSHCPNHLPFQKEELMTRTRVLIHSIPLEAATTTTTSLRTHSSNNLIPSNKFSMGSCRTT
jgi:CxxC motif-containing protein